MAGSASPMKTASSGKNLGKFHCKYFNMFKDSDVGEYMELRQKDSDKSSGITIDIVKEYIRKVKDTTYDGDQSEVHEEEIPHVYIEWWEKPVERKHGGKSDEKNKWLP